MEIQEMEVHQTVKKYILTEDEHHSLINKIENMEAEKLKSILFFA